jgi:hypothetical protein
LAEGRAAETAALERLVDATRAGIFGAALSSFHPTAAGCCWRQPSPLGISLCQLADHQVLSDRVRPQRFDPFPGLGRVVFGVQVV